MYLNRFVRDLLKPALAEHTFTGGVVPVFTTSELQDVPTKLPVVRARGQNAADVITDFTKALDLVVDVYAADEDMAYEVSKFIYDHVLAQWKKQTVFADGWIHKFECPVYPTNVDDPAMPDRVVRYLTNFDLTVRHA